MTRLDLRLMLVSDATLCGGRGVVATVREAVEGGVTVVQVRDKTASAVELLALVEEVTAACPGTPVLVNDRVDVYLAARAGGVPVAGVHVGQSDLPVDLVRELVGPDAIVGLTGHLPEHLAAVAQLPPDTVDYLGVGALRATRTKPDHPPPLGLAGLAAVCGAATVPCVAIGGIEEEDVAGVRAAGAAGVAVVSAVCASDDPRETAARLRKEWDR